MTASHFTLEVEDDETIYEGTYVQLRNADGSVVTEATAARATAVTLVPGDDPPPPEPSDGEIVITTTDEEPVEYRGTFVQLRNDAGDVISEFPYARIAAEDGIVIGETSITITTTDEQTYEGTFMQLRDDAGNVVSEFPLARVGEAILEPIE